MLFIISIVLICSISIAFVSAQDNSTGELQIDESSNINSIDNGEILSDDEVGTFTVLANLIRSSSGEINLTKNYKFVSGDSVSSSGIAINKALKINGNNHTIDASNRCRVFSISGSNVVLNNITFTNSYEYNNPGSVIYSTGSYLRINDCNFKNNPTTYGVIFMDGYGSSVSCSTFIDNHGYGATAIYWTGNYGTIDNCKFIHNTASYESGGAVYMYGQRGTIKNSDFINNSAQLEKV